MATTVARLEAILSAKTHDFDSAMAKSETKMQRVGKVAGVAGLAIAGGLAFGLERSVKAALGAQVSQARLEQAFKRSGLSADLYRKQVDKLEASGRKLGFTDATTKTALGSLLIATHSMTKASADLSVAQDLARFKHVDLTTATKSLTMAMAGSQRALKQLGIDVPKTTLAQDALRRSSEDLTTIQGKLDLAQAKQIDKQRTAALVIETVRQRLGGQADAYSKTAAGGMEQFRAQLDHLEVSLGKGLLPALAQVAAALATAASYFSAHTRTTRVLIIATAALGAAFLSASIYAKIMSSALVSKVIPALVRTTAGQWALNAAVSANPYVAAAVAIAALVAGLVILQERYQGVTRAVQFLHNHLYALLAVPVVGEFTAIAIVADKASKHLDGLAGVFRSIAHWAREALNAVKDLVGWIGKIKVPHISIPHISIPGIGDGSGPGAPAGARGPVGGGGKGPASIDRSLWDELASAQHFGLSLTSGYRAGAVTKHGTPSDHGVYPSKAIDVSNGVDTPQERAFFRSLIGDRGVKQAFFDPLGSIFGGVWNSYREGGHSNHVHVATYDQGGWLKSGLTLAMNNTGRAERVVSGNGDNIVIPVSIGGEHVATVIFDQLRRKAKVFENRNGRPAFGGA